MDSAGEDHSDDGEVLVGAGRRQPRNHGDGNDDGGEGEDVDEYLAQFGERIEDYVRRYSTHSDINFRVNSFDTNVFRGVLRDLSHILQGENYRLGISFGFLMRHRKDRMMRLFYASENTTLFTNLIYRADRPDQSIARMYSAYNNTNVTAQLANRAPDSAWIFDRPIHIRIHAILT